MRNSIFFFFLSFAFFTSFAQTGKKIYPSKAPDNGVMIASDALKPGDTIVIRSSLNPWSYVYCGGLKGTREKPIVIINEGAVLITSGFDLNNCQFVKLTGSGDKEKYGFFIHLGGVALVIHGKSADIEAERFFADSCAFGCWIKNEADCDSSINNWVLNNIRVHDYKMQKIQTEGFYMGSTDANNASRPVNCNGAQEYYKPSKLGNIKIYNGLINGTGRPAIMLSNAQIGMSEIYNNTISNVGREYNDQQGTGISLGLYTRAYVHHNTVKNTYTWGIASLGGSGLIRIENNVIDSSGYLDGKKLNWPHNIFIDTRPTSPVDTTRFIIINNKVSSPGEDAKNIAIGKNFDTYSNQNIICGNTTNGKKASLDIAPGISWLNCNILQKSTAQNNFKTIFLIGFGGLIFFVIVFLFIKNRFSKPYRKDMTRAGLAMSDIDHN